MTKTVAIPKVQTVKPSNIYWRLLLYGGSGTGKTTLAATANLHPEMAPVLIINFDEGLASVAHVEGLHYVTVETPDEMLVVLSQFLLDDDKREPAYRGIKTVIIDSVTSWRNKALLSTVAKNTERDVKRGKNRELALPQLQDHGEVVYNINAILHGLIQRPVHLILTAEEEKEQDQVSGVVTSVAPAASPSLSRSLGYMMSYIWYTKMTGGGYRLLTQQKGVYQIKTRNPRFREALSQDSVRRARELFPDDPEKIKAAEGWFVPQLDYDTGLVTPGLHDLYDLYLQSMSV